MGEVLGINMDPNVDPMFGAEAMFGEHSMGTSIMAVAYEGDGGGVVIGADSRTSTGSYIANRASDKLTPISDNVYVCRSGSAADTQALASTVTHYIRQHSRRFGLNLHLWLLRCQLSKRNDSRGVRGFRHKRPGPGPGWFLWGSDQTLHN